MATERVAIWTGALVLGLCGCDRVFDLHGGTYDTVIDPGVFRVDNVRMTTGC